MLTTTLKTLFRRDLEKLVEELSLYKNESKIWYTEKGISNSAGNLALHLVGNLNTFIGLHLGNTGYVRHRELEFSQKDVPRATLTKMIEDTIVVIEKAMDGLTQEQVEALYPIEVFGGPIYTGHFLVHLSGHLMYHLG
ncbi:DinB superfamily protein, partial [Chitinophaga sancti]|uniref:DinB superfamily protein n=1 Tax=Chitinophaga sancti TaxID=1004 RepID=UPI003F7AB4C3